MSTPPKRPKTQPEGGRTVALAAIVPPDNSGQKVFLLSCGVMIGLAALIAASCALLNTSASFIEKPAISLVGALGAATLAVPYALVILWLDRNEKEPPHILASAFLWGAVMATMFSCVVNSLFGAIAQGVIGDAAVSHQLTASLSAPPTEEFTKGLALLAIFLFFRKDFDNVMDGITYGAITGLGFAAFENFMYYAGTNNLAETATLIFMRGVLSGMGGSHACYTAITGIGFGLFRVMRKGALRWAMPPLFLSFAIFTHFAWNTFVGLIVGNEESAAMVLFVKMPLAVAVLQLPFLFMVFSVAFFSLRHEHKLIQKYLASEAPPILLPGELDALIPARRRTFAQLRRLLSFQWKDYARTRTRQRLLIRLAFEKWHMDQEALLNQNLEGHYHATRVIQLRQQLSESK